MFFRQILQTDLGCASYLIADRGEAAVVDPRWDVAPYLAAAAEANARIGHPTPPPSRVTPTRPACVRVR